MRRRGQVLGVLAGAAAVWCAGAVAVPCSVGASTVPAARLAAQARAVLAADSWGRAIAVPGLRALNQGGDAQVSSLSCPSPANCAAGGYYRNHGSGGGNLPGRYHRAFVVDERHGRWGRAIAVTGLRALAAGGESYVDSVSCGAAGSCAAGGDYWNHGHQGFVAVEKNGRWGRAIKVAGPVRSVSCGAAGNCAAGGVYRVKHRNQGFVAVEKNGRWSRGMEVPGLGALNTGGNASVDSVSCASADSCAVGGRYRNHGDQGFVAAEKNGVWGQAIEVPGLGALNEGGNAEVHSVSCGAAGSCAAGGGYTDGHSGYQGFVAAENNGVWGQAIEVPGLGALNAGNDIQYASVGSVSCASARNCAVGGSVGDPYPWGFVASEKNGVWGQATVTPGPGSRPWAKARYAGVSSVSCASPGNCAVGGGYLDVNSGPQGFVAVERNGRWGQAIDVPGLAVLNKGRTGEAAVLSVSCALTGSCAAGGSYRDGHGQQGFVT